jgi:hypothetical protein
MKSRWYSFSFVIGSILVPDSRIGEFDWLALDPLCVDYVISIHLSKLTQHMELQLYNFFTLYTNIQYAHVQIEHGPLMMISVSKRHRVPWQRTMQALLQRTGSDAARLAMNGQGSEAHSRSWLLTRGAMGDANPRWQWPIPGINRKPIDS